MKNWLHLSYKGMPGRDNTEAPQKHNTDGASKVNTFYFTATFKQPMALT